MRGESDTSSEVGAGDDERPPSRRMALLATAGAKDRSSVSFVSHALVLLPLLLLASLATLLLLRWWARLPSTPTAQQALHFDYLAATPTAVASFLHRRYLVNGQLAPGVPPGARTVSPGQVFDLTLTLELPECPVNRDLGVFQITAALLTSGGQVVALSSRAAQLRYRSLVTRALRTALWAPLLALDMRREVQTVTVPLFEGYPESRAAPFTALRVNLTSPGGKPAVQVYSATARLALRLGWLQSALHYWPLTSGAAILVSSFCTYASIAAVVAAARLMGAVGRGGGAAQARTSEDGDWPYGTGRGDAPPAAPLSPLPRGGGPQPRGGYAGDELAPSDGVLSDEDAGRRQQEAPHDGDGDAASDDTDLRPLSPGEEPGEAEGGEDPNGAGLRQRRALR